MTARRMPIESHFCPADGAAVVRINQGKCLECVRCLRVWKPEEVIYNGPS